MGFASSVRIMIQPPTFTPGVSPTAPACPRCHSSQWVFISSTGSEPLELHCTMDGTYWWPNHTPQSLARRTSVGQSWQFKRRASAAEVMGLLGQSVQWMSYPDIRQVVGTDTDVGTPLGKLVKRGLVERRETPDGPQFRRIQREPS